MKQFYQVNKWKQLANKKDYLMTSIIFFQTDHKKISFSADIHLGPKPDWNMKF